MSATREEKQRAHVLKMLEDFDVMGSTLEARGHATSRHLVLKVFVRKKGEAGPASRAEAALARERGDAAPLGGRRLAKAADES
jgi:hypothetical protein